MPMNSFATRGLLRMLAASLVAGFCFAPPPCRPPDDTDAPKGAAVTVLKAAKQCFAAIVEVSGILIPKEETAVRPERPGLKVAEILAEAGDTGTPGQTPAPLTPPQRGQGQGQAPGAGW